MALTTEQLKAIQDYYAHNQGGGAYRDPNGVYYQNNATQGWGEDGTGATPATEWYGYQSGTPDSPYQVYDTAGKETRTGKMIDPNKMGIGDMIALGIIGGGAAGLFSGGAGGMFGIGGSGATSGAAAGPGSPGWGMDLGGAGAADTTYAANIGAGTGGAGTVGGGAGVTGFGDTGTMYAGADAGAAGSLGGGASVAGGAALSRVPSWLGPATAIAGGLLGSKGDKNTSNSQHTMDPRLDGPVFGPGGIVQRSQGLLAEQMSPERQQGWVNMQNVGQGLLSQPIAGNGYAQFQNRRLM